MAKLRDIFSTFTLFPTFDDSEHKKRQAELTKKLEDLLASAAKTAKMTTEHVEEAANKRAKTIKEAELHSKEAALRAKEAFLQGEEARLRVRKVKRHIEETRPLQTVQDLQQLTEIVHRLKAQDAFRARLLRVKGKSNPEAGLLIGKSGVDFSDLVEESTAELYEETAHFVPINYSEDFSIDSFADYIADGGGSLTLRASQPYSGSKLFPRYRLGGKVRKGPQAAKA